MNAAMQKKATDRVMLRDSRMPIKSAMISISPKKTAMPSSPNHKIFVLSPNVANNAV